ncbi:hypothetical protein ACJIZ3_003169 [Penstemon smallii]|uniref:GRAM domain-containing protein n=1 Tax=Penstemon smallii TaxID=265156 RepID=A0ABD3U8J4_9LAMI
MNPSNQPHPQPQPQPSEPKPNDYAPYPKLGPDDVAPVADTWTSNPTSSGSVPISGGGATTMPSESNPYVSSAPVPKSTKSSFFLKIKSVVIIIIDNMEKVKDVLDKLGKKAAEATKKAEDLAGNMWQHLKTGPSLADAAVGRIAQSTKVLAEGGYEKVFQQTFETVPEEKLLKTYSCYLSTSAGPVVGVLYLSTAKIAFCSDNPLSYKVSEEVCWSYYKVIIPLNQLKAINPITSKVNPAEKYIQIISVDNHEFWFMGFLNYDSAVKSLLGTLQPNHL